MTTASSVSSLRLSHVWDLEAKAHDGHCGAAAATLYLHAVPADPQKRQRGPAGWIDSSEQGGRDHG
jgi:hypothetical protein